MRAGNWDSNFKMSSRAKPCRRTKMGCAPGVKRALHMVRMSHVPAGASRSTSELIQARRSPRPASGVRSRLRVVTARRCPCTYLSAVPARRPCACAQSRLLHLHLHAVPVPRLHLPAVGWLDEDKTQRQDTTLAFCLAAYGGRAAVLSTVGHGSPSAARAQLERTPSARSASVRPPRAPELLSPASPVEPVMSLAGETSPRRVSPHVGTLPAVMRSQ